MNRPTLLDLFCGAGGAGEGYRRAGFNVVGVDIKAQKNNPHAFIQADALEYLAEHGERFSAIHASPPCQRYSVVSQRERNSGRVYPDLVASTREALIAIGKPWIIENVPGAPVRPDVVLCGSMFGLRVIRHRLFECSFPIFRLMPMCQHNGTEVDLTGSGGRRKNARSDKKGGDPRKPLNIADARSAIGINWMNRVELSQSIPPDYTEYLGRELMQQL